MRWIGKSGTRLICVDFGFGRFVRNLEENFTLPLFAQICVSGAVICALTVILTRVSRTIVVPRGRRSIECHSRFSLQTNDTLAILNYALLLYGLVLLILLPCYFGTLIMFKSDRLSTDIYSSNWMRMDIGHRKIILIFQERLKRIANILVGRVFVLSLVTFTSVSVGLIQLFSAFHSSHSPDC